MYTQDAAMSVSLCHRLSGTQWQRYNGWYTRYVMRQQRHSAFPSGGLPPHGASEQRKPTSLVKFCTRRHASNKVTWPSKRLISNFTRCMNQVKRSLGCVSASCSTEQLGSLAQNCVLTFSVHYLVSPEEGALSLRPPLKASSRWTLFLESLAHCCCF